MLLFVLLALQDAPLPTVGDTVWVVRTHALRADVSIRPRPIAATAAVEPLGAPEVIQSGAEARVRYPLVVWRPGDHRIEVPGPILVRRDGWSDTLRATTAVIRVASVLPAGPRDSLAPQPPHDILMRSSTSWLPVLFLLVLTSLPLGVLHWWWRRRGPEPDASTPGRPAELDRARLDAWVAAGEIRTAAEGWHHRIAMRAGPVPDEATRPLLERLRRVRYEAVSLDEGVRACRDAAAWDAARGG